VVAILTAGPYRDVRLDLNLHIPGRNLSEEYAKVNLLLAAFPIIESLFCSRSKRSDRLSFHLNSQQSLEVMPQFDEARAATSLVALPLASQKHNQPAGERYRTSSIQYRCFCT